MKRVLLMAFIVGMMMTSLLSKEIKIGVILPMSGPVGGFGQNAFKGIELAKQMKPKLDNGDSIKIVLIDNKSDKIESANGMSRLISKDKVTAIIGALTSTNTMAITKIADDNKIPLVTPVATNVLVTKNRKYVSRVCFSDSFQGVVAAEYLYKNLGKKSVVLIIDSKSDYSIGLAKSFRKAFKKLGGKIIKKIMITAGDKDFKAQISMLKNLKPEAIYMPIYSNEAALIAIQAKQLGLKTLFMGSDGMTADDVFFKIGKDAINGFNSTDLFSADAPINTKLGKEFSKLYQEKYKTKVHPFAIMSADAYFLIVDAMQKCGDDKECINKTIRETKNFQGASGVISLDKNGDAIRSAVINEVENGKLKFKAIINP